MARRIGYIRLLLLLALCLAALILPKSAAAAEDVPGDSCAGITAHSFRWAGGPENGGVLNGLFCESNTWTEAINFQSSGRVGIGTTTPGHLLDVVGSGPVSVNVWSKDSYATQSVSSYSSTPWQAAFFQGWRSRGTSAAATAVASGDRLLSLDAWGYDGAAAQRAAQIFITVDNTVSSGVVPGTIQFWTADAAGVNTERLRINSSGNVGIGTASPAAKLHVVGDIRYTGVIVDVSDRRAKDDIRPLPSGQLAKMMQLQPVSFVMKNDPKRRTELGLIAQDTEPLFPDLVQTDPDGTKSLGYVGLVAPLIKAMQEQQAEIDHLRAGLAVVFCIALVPGFLLWRNRAK